MFTKNQVQSEAFDNTLIELSRKNPKIIALTADMADRIIPKFSREFRERFFNYGIAEQGMMGTAAGLAKCGLIPFVTTLVVFLSMRACEQVRTDVAYSKANVKIIGTGGGLVYGTLGATHQGLEDLSLMRSIANLTVMAPADFEETVCTIKAAVEYNGPVYIRLGRGAVPAIHNEETIRDFQIGKAIRLIKGSEHPDISILATGVMVSKAMEAAEKLRIDGISAAVYSMHTVKPLDIDAVLEAAESRYGVITVEDNNLCGGFGEAVSAVLGSRKPAKISLIGIPDTYPILGEPEELYSYYKMDAESIADCAVKMIKK